jgi:hypothetical protein
MGERVSIVADQCGHLDGVRAIRSNDGVFAVFVRPEDGMRIVMFAGQQPVQVGAPWCQIPAGQLIGSSHLRLTPCAIALIATLRERGAD